MLIDKLSKDHPILLFRRCWALEKVHGTDAFVSYGPGIGSRNPGLSYFPGNADPDRFIALFDAPKLRERFASLGHHEVTIYGTAYGGKGMQATYGDELRFIAFDVHVSSSPSLGSAWLAVPEAARVVEGLGLEFVPFHQVSTDPVELDKARDAPSGVAQRRGCGADKARRGVVLRPLLEVWTNGDRRVIAEHLAPPLPVEPSGVECVKCPTCGSMPFAGGSFGITQDGVETTKGWSFTCPNKHHWKTGPL